MARPDAISFINGEMMESGRYVNHWVRVVGKVTAVNGPRVQLETCDQRSVVVLSDNDGQYHEATGPVEVVGCLRADGTLEEREFSDFGANFDLRAHGDLVRLMGSFQEVF
mmetsp:Transcript_22732/g.37429  ORF Transcript_22732/g.37429 Transcript_22732/m.37429 type:complete len:110 (+) Transcript_22732:118-447(+)